MEEKKVLLSIRDLYVKFRVRGRVLTAIRGASLDIYENESIAIVGESGCGKSVLTKTFAGMLDNNGFIDHGDIIFNDEELMQAKAPRSRLAKSVMAGAQKRLDRYAKLALGAGTYQEILALEKERAEKGELSKADTDAFEAERKELVFRRAEAFNRKQTLHRTRDKARIRELSRVVSEYDGKIKALERNRKRLNRERSLAVKHDAAYNSGYRDKLEKLKAQYEAACAGAVSGEARARNQRLAKEIYLSVSRYPYYKWPKLLCTVYGAFRKAMELGVDLDDETQLNHVFETAMLHVKYLDETPEALRGETVVNLAKDACMGNWTTVRGRKVATVFQDPMTSLNPILTIGKQITSVIMRHQNVSEVEARKRAIVLMKKVGIPNAENRFDDYPFQYSGGMRQRIVIAIALSCQPKLLICDEPTTALDVTIQAQILKLIKDLQQEFGYTIVFITHDLGVVANIADRVAVLYAGQLIEIGTVEEVFYDPRHPYTWVLLSSLPQLMERNRKLYSIAGTPPSLYNRITGDAFAPRNPYALKIDTLKEPPMFQVTQTHYAKTWLLDPRAPKVEKPAIICDIHGTLKKVFNI